ncbi:DUF2815 domain-containing protein [Mesorhizobium sp. B3-1-3]|uniref:DUF2815 domain-containing protein n=1 Tax=unclassified Mesorhizobium TaxID=325217 RepID=UPI00112DE507|nr:MULTISPECIES: DUF2815 domain-containing protein [unclassified Mesorhizobium]TPI67582.1 DUF2815 domain-containing protein [Mesorhizobium sp. B3-1-8]TPI75628.1 DUF2815 domain-containing protein [Mesorhizobium sp. B3-1-3]
MATDTKKKLPSFTTTRGTFVYPKLNEPDYGNKDYPKPDGEYSLKFRMSKADADAFVNRKVKQGNEEFSLQSLYEDALRDAESQFAELKVESRKKLGSVKPNDLFTVLYDQETEEETGDVEFKFKMKASGEFKKGPKEGQFWTRRPDLFDARGAKIKGIQKRDNKGNPIKDKAGKPTFTFPNIWGGTIGKVSFATRPYFVAGTAAAGLTLMLAGVQIIDLVSEGERSANSYGFGEEEGYGYDPEDQVEESQGENTSSDEGTSDKPAGEDDF